MVAISKSRLKQKTFFTRQEKQERLLITLLGVVGGVFLLVRIRPPTTSIKGAAMNLQQQQQQNAIQKDNRPHLNLQHSTLLSESYNAIAMDIITTLDCKTLLNKTVSQFSIYNGRGTYDDFLVHQEEENGFHQDNNRLRRRLQQKTTPKDTTDDGDDSPPKEQNGQGDVNLQDAAAAAADGGVDDHATLEEEGNRNDDILTRDRYQRVNAKELFCLAAATTMMPPDKIKQHQDRIQCQATGTKQETLLDLWSSARAQMTETLLLKTLELATETTRTLGRHTVHLWSPLNDDGMNYIISQVSNQDESARINGNNFFGLSHNLGPGHLYVDVGSCLGITTLAVILEYPKTKVVSLEPAAPNWLMQEMNMKCNLDQDQLPTLLLAGVGPHTKEVMAAKLLWRPSAVTATRAWTPVQEKVSGEDEELFVQLRPWKSLLAEAGVSSRQHIDVLHVDCEGCEYNLIPSLTDSEFESIDTVMGDLHWGYIPQHKLPSSKRGQLTHDRLCQHENFARTSKECCGNLHLKVKSSIPGEVLIQEGKDTTNGAATVADVIEENLCNDFDIWKEEHHFYDIEDDYGWFEISSVAA